LKPTKELHNKSYTGSIGPNLSHKQRWSSDYDGEQDIIQLYKKIARLQRLWDRQLRFDVLRAFTRDLDDTSYVINFTDDPGVQHEINESTTKNENAIVDTFMPNITNFVHNTSRIAMSLFDHYFNNTLTSLFGLINDKLSNISTPTPSLSPPPTTS